MISGIDGPVLVTTTVSSAPGVGDALLLLVAGGGILSTWLSDITSGLNDRFSHEKNDQDPTQGDDFYGEGADLDDLSRDDLNTDEFEDLLGDVDDWDDENEIEDPGDDGSNQAEIERRIDDLENDVANLTSTMGTVKSENEEIIRSVEDIEDNVRKLLDIYEMVTQGVNPFIDESQNVGEAGGSFGLFDDIGGAESHRERDSDVAEGDPDTFFDDRSFIDENADDDARVDETVIDEIVGDRDNPFSGDLAGSTDGGEGDGKTFDDLKSEYRIDTTEDDVGRDDGMSDESATATDVETAKHEDESGELADVDDGGAVISDGTSDPFPPTESRRGGDASPRGEDDDGARNDKPYLYRLPSGYGAEMLIIEWLTYLRQQSSSSEAHRALKYYETIDWIGGDVANSLQRYLAGLSADDERPVADNGTQLTIDHHTTSLNYIGKLSGDDVKLKQLEWTAPGRSRGDPERRGEHGIQR